MPPRSLRMAAGWPSARRIPGATISYKGHEFAPRTALFPARHGERSRTHDHGPITTDMGEGMKTLRDLPGYDWAADGASIILTQGGQIRRLWVESGEVDTIPFEARCSGPFPSKREEASPQDGPFKAPIHALAFSCARWQQTGLSGSGQDLDHGPSKGHTGSTDEQ